ncbi:hypothetical protein [Auraticoccus monumenti]|uniref:Uncharacterized protein n=1 Tax=Auraticoccus monumenti TaxID=675864 RepID=A0A1G6YKC1_9ACTN|nr:hypothetical protein [Auraticoccus monumenti]SDD90016.1 hypothetical protein SAMN04489747_2015 [Auraticoccus monumenti]
MTGEPPPSWPQRLAYTVTGEVLGGDEEAGEDPVGAAAALLAADGWGAERVLAHADARRSAELPWPHPLPPTWLPPGSHARFAAQREALVQLVGGRRQAGPARGGTQDARDRQLEADRPPHW